MAARLHEANARFAHVETRMKCRAAAALAVCVDERIDIGLNAGTCERVDDQPALPFAVGVLAITLNRTAAARAVIRTERRLAIRRGRDDLEELAGFSGNKRR